MLSADSVKLRQLVSQHRLDAHEGIIRAVPSRHCRRDVTATKCVLNGSGKAEPPVVGVPQLLCLGVRLGESDPGPASQVAFYCILDISKNKEVKKKKRERIKISW